MGCAVKTGRIEKLFIFTSNVFVFFSSFAWVNKLEIEPGPFKLFKSSNVASSNASINTTCLSTNCMTRNRKSNFSVWSFVFGCSFKNCSIIFFGVSPCWSFVRHVSAKTGIRMPVSFTPPRGRVKKKELYN